MTKIHKPVVTNTPRILRHTMLVAALGFAAGLAAAVGAMQHVPDAVAANEQAIVAACKLPDTNGAVTIFTMRDNKLECGRYR